MGARVTTTGRQGLLHALQLDPNFYQAYANRALVLRQMNKNPEAVADYNRALQINPNYDTAYIGRGNIYRVANRNREALADFQKAIDLNTTDPRAYHNRGLLYQLDGQPVRRSRTSRPRSRWSPTRPSPIGRGHLLSRAEQCRGRDGDDINRAIQLDGKRAEFWVQQASF